MPLSMQTRERGTLKAKVTNFKKYLEAYNENPDSIALKLRYENLKRDFDRFNVVQTDIETRYIEDDQEAQRLKRVEFENIYYDCCSQAERKLREVNEISITNDVRTNESDSTVNSTNVTKQINFPRLDLPKFDGEVENWPSFTDTFKLAVHNDVRLADVQKLIYLRSCLTGEAANKLESLPTTDANYNVAWSLLEKTYFDPNALVFRHVRVFFNFPTYSATSTNSIGEITNLTRKHYRALQALKTPFSDAFPIYAVLNSLDDATQMKWKETFKGERAPNMEDLLDFLDERQRVTEDQTFKNNKRNVNPNHSKNINLKINKSTNNATRSVSTALTAQTSMFCHICKSTDHYAQNCNELTKLSIADRAKLIYKLKLCYNCLRANHAASNCRAGNYKNCGKKHHTLLHKDKNSAKQTNSISCLGGDSSSQVLLSTALVYFFDKNSKTLPARVLLDSGSQINFISDKLAGKLGLPEKIVNRQVTGINNAANIYTREVDVSLKSRVGNYMVKLSYLIRKNFEDAIPACQVNLSKLDLPSNIALTDPQFYLPRGVDALLGAKIFYKLLCPKQKILNSQNTVIQKTRFGWVVAGDVPIKTNAASFICNWGHENLERQLEKFWTIEQVSSDTRLSPEEAFHESHYSANTERDPVTGRYTVRLPFKENKNDLGETYGNAIRRFYSLEKTLDKNSELKTHYTEFMKEYEAMGHMTLRGHSHELLYLPHHGVTKQTSLTTKLRVVFDASAKTSTGLSLNNVLHVGPVVQENLINIILRFRTYPIVLSADIEKMYGQINLNEADRVHQNIVWRDNKREKLRTYQLNTVTYGTAPASFLAARTLKQLANDEDRASCQASRAIKEDFYMDDLLTGANSLSEALALKNEIIKLTDSACLPLRKWASNEQALITNSPNDFQDNISLNIDETIKTLGLFWDAKNDVLTYTVNNHSCANITKRSILSKIARLFDPLGLLGPIIIRAKILMQRLWQIKVGWDDPLPQDICVMWSQYERQLDLINSVRIERKVVLNNYQFIELHGFCDSSEKAYGACFYVRTVDKSGIIMTRLLCSKSKVAPLKIISLPRLELSGALLLAKLLQLILSAMRNIKFEEITCWSDSTVVLNWIQTSPHVLKTFVSNRVTEIQDLTKSSKWRHVASEHNPADLL